MTSCDIEELYAPRYNLVRDEVLASYLEYSNQKTTMNRQLLNYQWACLFTKESGHQNLVEGICYHD